MELTLLKAVQMTLSALDSNNIDTLADGDIEAEQVVFIANRVYNDILSRREWPFLIKEGTLIASGEQWEMVIPDNYTTIHEVRYRNNVIKYINPTQFNKLIYSRNTDEDNVNDSFILIDRDPIYYTSYDDTTLVFDSFNHNVESNLLESNSYIIYNHLPNSMLDYDEDVPDIPYRFMNVWLDGILAHAYAELKQDNTNAQYKFNLYNRGISSMIRWARNIEDTKPNAYANYISGIRSI